MPIDQRFHFLFFNMISQPRIRYTFDIKDASLFYSTYDNSFNFDTPDSIELDDGLCISGVNPEAVFMFCRNVLACREPIQDNFIPKDYQVKAAKDMITALQKFVDSKEKKQEPECNCDPTCDSGCEACCEDEANILTPD